MKQSRKNLTFMLGYRSRKEVFQRTFRYGYLRKHDLAPITSFTLGRPCGYVLQVPAFWRLDGRCVQGLGTYLLAPWLLMLITSGNPFAGVGLQTNPELRGF